MSLEPGSLVVLKMSCSTCLCVSWSRSTKRRRNSSRRPRKSDLIYINRIVLSNTRSKYFQCRVSLSKMDWNIRLSMGKALDRKFLVLQVRFVRTFIFRHHFQPAASRHFVEPGIYLPTALLTLPSKGTHLPGATCCTKLDSQYAASFLLCRTHIACDSHTSCTSGSEYQSQDIVCN